MTFRDYLECIEDTFNCLTKKYGENDAIEAIALYNERYVEDLSMKYMVYYDIGEMTFGQFSYVENAYNNKDIDRSTALKLIAVNVIRPKKEIVYDNIDTERESRHINSILDENAKDVIDVLNKFANKRNDYLHKTFKGVFYKEPDEDESAEEDKDDKPTDLEFVFNTKWYWYQIKDMLSNKDITKHSDIEDMKMYRVAPHLAYLQIKGKLEYKRMKDEQIRNRLK